MRTNDWVTAALALVAIVVSVFALLAARRSAAESKRSADAATSVSKLEQQRRHDERAPKLVATFYRAGDRISHHELSLVHEGGADCDVIDVSLEKPGSFDPVISGFSHTGQPWTIAPFMRGDEHAVTVKEPKKSGGRVIVRCICRSGDETWDLRLPLEVGPASAYEP